MNGLKTKSSHSVPSESIAGRHIRKKKILNIRRRLARGDYHINERLNVVLDRILEDIIYRKEEQ